MTAGSTHTRLEKALAARAGLFDAAHESAFRLFAGFFEGEPSLVIDLYGATVVVHNYAEPCEAGVPMMSEAVDFLRARLPWLRCGILKTRHAPETERRRGVLLFGDAPDREVKEHGVRYAVDLRMNRDCSLYLDTREVRRWALENLRGKSVLNTFAYTGSLGVAAKAGGASDVVHLDLNREFLALGKASYALNNLPVVDRDFFAGDFWRQVAFYKRTHRRFDCVLLDPPFFAESTSGVVDLAKDSARLINKVRPLLNDGGHLVAINNALFVDGCAYHDMLDALCADGYLEIEQLIPVPGDFTGYAATRTAAPITDPAPFNHSTKIAVLKVRRKPG